jgi:glycosyltransferase involved in cell wall biosynthesis
MKVLVCGGNPRMIAHFRGPLLRELVNQGHEVVAAGGWPDADVEAELSDMGVRYQTWPVIPTGLNPLRDLSAIRHLVALCRAERPDVFFGYALKPAAYGAVAAAIAKVPRRVILIEGLGYAFGPGREVKRRIARTFATLVFFMGLKATQHLVVLNRDDEAFFRKKAPRLPITRVPGIGVDLDHFQPSPLPQGPTTFLMISRLLKDKGVDLFVDAARRVKATLPNVRFLLVGPWDPSPNGISETEVRDWHAQGWIEYVGTQPDVRPFLAQSHVLMLPSYREGFPTTVMEAAASGRAVITTDAPGCRDSIIAGETGLLVPPGNAQALFEAVKRLIDEPETVHRFGLAGRTLAERIFSHRRHAERMADIITRPEH